MSRYFDALNRVPAVDETRNVTVKEPPERPRLYALPGSSGATRVPYTVVPAGTYVSAVLARTGEIQRLSETFAATVNTSNDGRLVFASCTTGDGSSTVAAAIALDLSQRLGIRTLLVDGNLRRANFSRMFATTDPTLEQRDPNSHLKISSTKWARLELANLRLTAGKTEYEYAIGEVNRRVAAFPAAIIDLGTVRVDSRALPLARDNDPVLLVVRAGYTRRQELLATNAILTNGAKRVGGVVLNGIEPATPQWLRRLLGGI